MKYLKNPIVQTLIITTLGSIVIRVLPLVSVEFRNRFWWS
jgi:hypothetical protein